MKKAVHKIERKLLIGINIMFLAITQGRFRADEDFAKRFGIDGKGNTVGWTRVVEKLRMEIADFLFCHKMNENLRTNDFLEVEKGLDEGSYSRQREPKIPLPV